VRANAGGRIDATEHPFTTGYYTDVRITTKYYVNNFQKSMFSTLHEASHTLYNMRRAPRRQAVHGLTRSQIQGHLRVLTSFLKKITNAEKD
jgi:Zn-dependent M32 family carboxypeptidase